MPDEPIRQARTSSTATDILPAGACDAHLHIFGPAHKFPFAPERTYTPADASFEMMRDMHARLGIQRGVIVQPNCHGFDMSATLDALQRGEGRYRAVALVPADVGRAELERLDKAGVRGVRFNIMPHLGDSATPQDMASMAARIADLGWHLCIHTQGTSLPELLPVLKALPVPYIIDHMGRVDASQGIHGEAFQTILALRGSSGAWVKISGADRLSGGHAPYRQGRDFMRVLLDAMPEQLLWGTDWPHPNVAGAVPDDMALLDFFLDLCPQQELREQILVHNPQTLYRFEQAFPTGEIS